MDNSSETKAGAEKDCKRRKIEDEYFQSYTDPAIHQLMLADKPRTETYKKAIFDNKEMFAGKICLDVGAGTGILSLFMAEAGAKLVHSVEASAMSVLTQKIVDKNGYSDVIKVHSCTVETAPIDRGSVDIIISEWMGFYLFHESMLSSVLYARDKYLKPGGHVFPTEYKLYSAPCSLNSFYDDDILFWNSVYGYNMEDIGEYASKLASGKPQIISVPQEEILGDPVLVKEFNILYCEEDILETMSASCFSGITKPGNYRGICLWFDCDFLPSNAGRPIVTLSTSPFVPQTHWKQTVVVFDRSQSMFTNVSNEEICDKANESTEEVQPRTQHQNDYEVEADEVVGWNVTISPNSENPRHYDLMFEILDAEDEEHPVPCSCPMMKCRLIKKMMEDEEEDCL